MSIKIIEQRVSERDIDSALEECMRSGQFYLGLMIGRINPRNTTRYHEAMGVLEKGPHRISTDDGRVVDEKVDDENQPLRSTEEVISEIVEEKKVVPKAVVQTGKIRVKVMCNWCSSEELANLWNKMSKGNYTWDDIQIVWEDPADYYVIVNSPPQGAKFDKKKTIVFRMEPNMSNRPEQWGEWADPKDNEFLFIGKHERGHYNNNEWHLSKSYNELLRMTFTKNPTYDGVVSTVLSGKYTDPGQVKRVDFVKFLEKKGLPVHVYGNNRWDYKDYKGSLPIHCKDDAIFPYKYIFNAENQNIKNYYTEKLIDGILGESLVFYSGCFNVREFIDERAYVQLSLSNFDRDYQTIKKAIEQDWYSERLPYIKAAKHKILTQLQFFPRLAKIINDDLRKKEE